MSKPRRPTPPARSRRRSHPSAATTAWPVERQQEVAALYAAGASSVTLAARYGTNARWILTCVRRAGGTVRPLRQACARYRVNEQFFVTIDTEEATYALGFLLADGCVRVEPSPTLTVVLASVDADHLETLRRLLGAEHPVLHYEGRSVLAITSAPLIADLVRWGVTPRKSLSAVPPSVPPHLERHFWRGLLDGDGCVSLQQGGVLHLAGSHAVVSAFREVCLRVAPGSTAQVHPAGPDRPSWQFALTGRRALTVLEWLYADATVALPRKAALLAPFRALIEARETRRRWRT